MTLIDDRDVGIDVHAAAVSVFEEPGTLEKVAVLARDWFVDHLSRVDAF